MTLFNGAGEEKALGLAELAGLIEEVISGSFERGFWVKAEMARLNLYPESGHCYPDLVEKEGRTIRAQMRGTIWAGNYQRIARQFVELTGETLHDGLQILFFAVVRFHPQYGLSLQITDIDPSYTLGQLARERLETIRKLKEEGVFDLNRNLDFPVLPKKIAVISVQTSKGYSDFMNILSSQAAEFHPEITLFPALLQGDKAVNSILGQLQAIRKEQGRYDLAAIIRGGGGDVGLSCYDNYRLAREVATFPIPVLTGIGHSTNETVVEMVAARNKITPTDVAYSLVEQFRSLASQLSQIGTTLTFFTLQLLSEEDQNLKGLSERLQNETLSRMQNEHLKLEMARKMLSTHLSACFQRKKSALDLVDSHIRLLDPKNILKRGYSITWFNGRPLKDAARLSGGDTVVTELFEGKFSSRVISKEE